ncbi:unnamed protein product [Kuraishia capsulata CBS 1993]|uniref:Protein transport protein SEC23 n=1 Tax=Kuraishia capsulata CBS 1993 TaxID=1382522 RepID=W6MXR3_9ASCO|nr:uncharacterized protein KUCA_T00005328001 [Kuraishia capsulata CBS 1993]CDK29340.1 unnamed protein product [Kuraishia capsulata CBS 1993]
MLPQDALVGMITYGKNVNVHERTNTEANAFSCFNGAKSYTAAQVQKTLGLLSNDLRTRPDQTLVEQYPGARYIGDMAHCEFQFTLIFEQLLQDSFPLPKYSRPERCTGAAITVAQGILESCFPKSGGHILVFTGGACTHGPGKIVGTALKEPIRSHHDIGNDSAKYYKKAKAYYDTLAKRAASNGHTLDFFIGSYDQVGMSEMEALPHMTGGSVILSDSFSTAIFKQSLQRFFVKSPGIELDFALNATLEVKVSKELKVLGLVGHATSLNTKNASVGDREVGTGATTAWKLCSAASNSSYAIYFDMANTNSQTSAHTPLCYIQYIMHYQHADGTMRLNVTTVSRAMMQLGQQVSESFDQEAAAVIVAREAVSRILKDDSFDAVMWLDKTLVELCTKFGDYRKADPSSFRLSTHLSLFPQFMFHLRRSPFVQVFNNSPDESAYIRHVFLTEQVSNTLVMIQPTLTSYSLDRDPEPVLLDSVSIKPDCILLLDTFFHILIYHGSQIADWRRLGYHERDDYEYFMEFLELPRQEAAEILVDRFPLPRFIDTEEGGSQARFLYSKLNPTTSYKTDAAKAATNAGAVILTDDVSLQDFMKYVNEAVVKEA